MSRARPASLLRSRLVLICAVIIIVFVASAIIQEARRRRAARAEIAAMVDEIDRLEQKRGQLSDLLERAGSAEFIEREARLQLGLRKSDELVFVVPENNNGVATLTDDTGANQSSNALKWWRRIFQ
ncbi:MAG: septum formation initiator family protein [Candidatus Uhrbacteria bacterium]